MSKLPAITGPQLIKLLIKDDWEPHQTGTHGMSLRKDVGGRVRVTVVPTKRQSLPTGTLRAILPIQQTGLGRDGLARLIEEHGLK